MCHTFVTCQSHRAPNPFVSRLSQPSVFFSCSVTTVPCHNFLSSITSPCPLSQLSVPCHSFLSSVTHLSPVTTFLSSGALNCDINVSVEQDLESFVVTVVCVRACVCVCVYMCVCVSSVNSETVCSPFHPHWTGQLVSSLVTASVFHCPSVRPFLFSCHSTIKQKQTNKQQMCCC